ncbi:flagellar basal body-associated FliL family protein [Salinispirillum sp. LH 10-3-1]|uniref:Flagellar protein FliL n=1 Tax=Salinispirillum sp. LH 10-3-1 TaxID=2952525 RepID=A0AB38YCB6_9GAMM
MTEQNNDVTEDDGAGKRKLLKILLMVIGLLLVIGLSVGLTLFLTRGWTNQPVDPELMGIEAVRGPAHYMALSPEFIVTYEVNSRQRFLKADIAIRTRDQRALDVLTQHMPLVRNNIIQTLSERDFSDLQTDAGREELVQSITEAVQGVMETLTGQPGIESVLFTNYVIQ